MAVMTGYCANGEHEQCPGRTVDDRYGCYCCENMHNGFTPPPSLAEKIERLRKHPRFFMLTMTEERTDIDILVGANYGMHRQNIEHADLESAVDAALAATEGR